ncbi:MAG: beta-galactosidase [Proteobacteria bacterium]|jgi:hypothetical protein|nr:beta-galactosidase [Pseudomonadota bacterium]
MDIMLLDYNRNFQEEDIKKFADAGTKTIVAFDWWWQTEPSPGVYDFGDWLAYEDMLNRHGVKLLIQTPIGVPFWADDPSWYLSNCCGEKNNFSSYAKLYNAKDSISFSHILVLAGRIFSYWNQVAENYVQTYIKKLREVLKHAVCISSIGQCGEYLFPATCFMSSDGREKVNIHDSPWWFDSFAQQKCQESGKPSEEWIVGELSRISKERINLYQEKWLQYVPYYNDPNNNVFGNVGCENVILENKDGLKTILFSAFGNDWWTNIAAAQAKICPTYTGAEGPKHVIENAHKAKQLGLEGLICAPVSVYADVDGVCFTNFPKMEDWIFNNIREANRILS